MKKWEFKVGVMKTFWNEQSGAGMPTRSPTQSLNPRPLQGHRPSLGRSAAQTAVPWRQDTGCPARRTGHVPGRQSRPSRGTAVSRWIGLDLVVALRLPHWRGALAQCSATLWSCVCPSRCLHKRFQCIPYSCLGACVPLLFAQ